MKYAACVLAHNKPTLLERTIRKIMNPNVEVFVHLDAKCKLSDYSHIEGAVFLHKRVNVRWGGRSMVVAMFNLIEYVVNYTDCDYLLFISGEDYPLVHPDKYDRFIDISKNYVEFQKLPRNDWYMRGGIDRLNKYYIFRSSSSYLSKMFVKLQKLLNITRNYWKHDFVIYGGSQWININRTAAKYIISNWSKYYGFFKYTHIPDEMIIQTILLNSHLKDSIINTNLRYVNFQGKGRNPVYINELHYPNIVNARAIFCRKIKDESEYKKIETFFSKNEKFREEKVDDN